MSRKRGDPGLVRRWLRFNTVGGLGVIVQLSVLAIARDGAGLHYLAATAIAVEAAILHNFLWHERWTWADRTNGGRLAGRLSRLLRFHLSNGVFPLTANIALMRVFAGWLRLHYLPANVLAIAACSAANFLAGDLFVFRRGYAGASGELQHQASE